MPAIAYSSPIETVCHSRDQYRWSNDPAVLNQEWHIAFLV
jgi:hypothetical protein